MSDAFFEKVFGDSEPTNVGSGWISGVLALALGVFTEWRFAPFAADDTLAYFLLHVHQLKPITLIMIVAGALIGFWIPFRRSQETGKA